VFKPLSPVSVSLPASTSMPDNSLCLVCHVNFAEDDSVANHISQGVTCAHCHGGSVEHMNDESLMTPPDILYGRSEVQTMCEQCHEQSHKNPKAVEVFRNKWAGQKRENGRNITEEAICTDCHGRHTVPRR
jgi:formate-dependent nitrite reductase cytochrome c552 subunit